MIGDYLEKYNFEYLMESALSKVPNTIDKREGSIIYDALAPACYELTEYYMRLKKILQDTFAETASEQYLDLRVAEQGITRFQSTQAIKKGEFTSSNNLPMVMEIGSRFSTISDTRPINYVIIAPYLHEGNEVPGSYQLICEEFGTIGNSYVGNLIPIDYMQGLSEAIITDLIIPARDVETDTELRTRYFLSLKDKPFGGNIAQYKEVLKDIDGVGAVQIYPAWDGGGTVKCSIIDAEFNPVSSQFIDIIQEMIDPPPQGEGLGLAPIGHKVLIVAPNELVINIETTIMLMSGYSKGQVEISIENAIEEYLLNIRKNWGIGNELNQYILGVYISRINAAILNVPGVANVTGTKINGVESDLNLIEDASTQELPMLGTVILNE